MPSFWPEGIGNAFPLSKNHCKCLSFWPEGIGNAFLFNLHGNFSLTIGMIMPLGWGEVTGIIPKLVTQGPFGFPTRHSWLRHLWLVGNPNGLSWLVWELFFPFTRGKPLVKGKSPCLRLSLKASRHFFPGDKCAWAHNDFMEKKLKCVEISRWSLLLKTHTGILILHQITHSERITVWITWCKSE